VTCAETDDGEPDCRCLAGLLDEQLACSSDLPTGDRLWSDVFEQWAGLLTLVVAAEQCCGLHCAEVADRQRKDPSYAKGLAVGLEARVGDGGAIAEDTFFSKAECARAVLAIEGRGKVRKRHAAGEARKTADKLPICDGCRQTV
jgi:hypothetical protein